MERIIAWLIGGGEAFGSADLDNIGNRFARAVGCVGNGWNLRD